MIRKRLKVAIVGGFGTLNSVGGFTSFTKSLVKKLHGDEIEFIIYAESKEKKLNSYNLFGDKYLLIPRKGKVGLIEHRINSINHAIRVEKVDIIYLLGYVSCGFINWKAAEKNNIKIIVNPDGLEWKRSSYNLLIKLILKYSEKIALKKANWIVADSKYIKKYLEMKYKKNNIIYIPYGIDFAELENKSDNNYPYRGEDYYTVVCRCVKENQLLEIMEGFKSSNVKKKLIVVTNFKDNKYGKKLLDVAKNDNRIMLNEPIIDRGGLYNLRLNAFGYIHGHTVGGTNPSLLEAMAAGNIILAHNNIFNREVLGESYEYIFINSKELKEKIELIESVKNQENIRKNLKNMVFEKYNMDDIAIKYKKLFFELT